MANEYFLVLAGLWWGALEAGEQRQLGFLMLARAEWVGSDFPRYGKQFQRHVILRLLAALQSRMQASQKDNDGGKANR